VYYNKTKIVLKGQKREKMETKTYRVPNINCGHCAHTIKMELADLEGVKSVEVDVEKKEVVVGFMAPATAKGIEELLTEINYPAETL